jgi:hypothetical protein
MALNRRDVLKIGGLAALAGHLRPGTGAAEPDKPASPVGAADYTIRIGTGLVELARDQILATTTYNGQFPGPLIRLKEGVPVVVDIHNDTDSCIGTGSRSLSMRTAQARRARRLFHRTECAASPTRRSPRGFVSIIRTSFPGPI